MRRPDDCSLTPNQLARIRREAERALREAGTFGVFPTPLEKIMAVARVAEAEEDALNPGLIGRLMAKASQAGQTIKRAVSKVLGIFHASDGLIFLNQSMKAVKKRFITLHESAHGFLPWQRPMYAVVEDCEKALDGDTAELFDREANVFASEVLFQLDTFRDMAESKPFEIWTPVRLATKFKASNYAAIRQYVSKSQRICAVLVLNMPELVEGDGFRASLRRPIQSPRFTETFGNYIWRDVYTPDDELGAFIPLHGRKTTGKRSMQLVDANGTRHDCVAESFSTGHNVFVLIHSVRTLTATRIIVPASMAY